MGTFQGVYRYMLYFIPDKAAAARGKNFLKLMLLKRLPEGNNLILPALRFDLSLLEG